MNVSHLARGNSINLFTFFRVTEAISTCCRHWARFYWYQYPMRGISIENRLKCRASEMCVSKMFFFFLFQDHPQHKNSPTPLMIVEWKISSKIGNSVEIFQVRMLSSRKNARKNDTESRWFERLVRDESIPKINFIANVRSRSVSSVKLNILENSTIKMYFN